MTATTNGQDDSIFGISLPEVADRNPYEPPTTHLEKTGANAWAEVPGRRLSPTLLVNRIRAAVDVWRADSYPGLSSTSRRLFQYWFEEDHVSPGSGRFRFYFCQREAIETLVYLHEVCKLYDAFDLVQAYYDEPAGAPAQLVITTQGQRKVRRFVADIQKEAEVDLPRKDLTRMAVKMATGVGKTVVMALAIAWSYLHRRFEAGSDLADNFLVLAPNVIVFERLRLDFEGGRIFRSLPIVPPVWEAEWQVDTILRGDPRQPKASGNLFLTNIQQVYDRPEQDDEPINPVAALLGKAPQPTLAAAEPMLSRIKKVRNLLVLNDEAHHLHDDTLRWNETLLELDRHLAAKGGTGLVAWLDFSATPKNQYGTFFPWIVVDYPLAQAVEDRIVKTPLVIHQTDRKDPDPKAYADAGEAYSEWIAIALGRWRAHVKDYGEVGEKPILFVMAETTKDADAIVTRLEREADLKGRVLNIHINERGAKKGEISDKDLDIARKAAREIDSGRSPYRAVVSVLLLREGWDVRNVSVILGLRPFSAEARILPEQAVGRGLRLMRKIPDGQTQILELIGTQAFEEFVRELEKEGLGIATTKEPPKPGKSIYPEESRLRYDIVLPRTTPMLSREYKNLARLDPLARPALREEGEISLELRKAIELVHGTVNVTVHSSHVEFNDDNVPQANALLASLTNRIIRRARITDSTFHELFPKVRDYARKQCFGGTVELDEVPVRRALEDGSLQEVVAGVFSRKIGELTAERQASKIASEPYQLSRALRGLA